VQQLNEVEFVYDYYRFPQSHGHNEVINMLPINDHLNKLRREKNGILYFAELLRIIYLNEERKNHHLFSNQLIDDIIQLNAM
jgi:hypothetical protein